MEKLKIGILGATGSAGMEFIRALNNHPWFQVAELYAGKSAGKRLEEVVELKKSDLPAIRNLMVKGMDEIREDLDMICSALPSEVAKKVEGECARHTPVISTASAYRYEKDVPLIITEINMAHYSLLKVQKEKRWKGWIAPGPNCTTVGLAMSLYPIHKEIGIDNASMSSYQAISGGGKELIDEWKSQRTKEIPEPQKNPIMSEDPPLILDGNVICRIRDEEDKVRRETKKILGEYESPKVVSADIGVDPKCFRVPVLYGHTASVFAYTKSPCTHRDIAEIYRKFNRYAYEAFGNLPSSPRNFVTLLERAPQPRIDVNLDKGMTASIGKIEPLDKRMGVSYVVLTHNLQRGAAKGIIHVAEYLHSIGFLGKK